MSTYEEYAARERTITLTNAQWDEIQDEIVDQFNAAQLRWARQSKEHRETEQWRRLHERVQKRLSDLIDLLDDPAFNGRPWSADFPD